MRKFVRSKPFVGFILFCLLTSAALVFFNLSQFQRYQLNKRNQQREKDVQTIISGLKNFITNNNNLPTTTNPDTKSFLPELLFVGSKPSGGVSVSTLESVQGYFDMNLKDPSGTAYLIGTFEDQIIVYTTRFERLNESDDVYYATLKVTSSPEGKVTTE
jgi:hypothetical protein